MNEEKQFDASDTNGRTAHFSESSPLNPKTQNERKRERESTKSASPEKENSMDRKFTKNVREDCVRGGFSVSGREDTVRIAKLREKLREECLFEFADFVERQGPLEGESKTASACRTKGIRVGLRAIYGRWLWSQLMVRSLDRKNSNRSCEAAEEDPIFVTAPVRDIHVRKELIEMGRTENEADLAMECLERTVFQSASILIEERKRQEKEDAKFHLLEKSSRQDSYQPFRLQEMPHRTSPNTIFAISARIHGFCDELKQIRCSHLKNVLNLYRMHTDDRATLQDRHFVSICC